MTEPITQQECLWRTPEQMRNFIVPSSCIIKGGSLRIRSLDGSEVLADERWLRRFEVSAQEARDWAQQSLGDALSQLKAEIDVGLGQVRADLEEVRHAPVSEGTKVTPDALPALMSLFGKLPRAIAHSLSSNHDHVACAKRDLLKIQERLREAGIDVGDKLEQFPERLAGLRADAAKRRRKD